jgi:putative NADH-flavin reductase
MLLLGATGRLGAHLLRGGLDRVWEVTALSASPEKIKIRGPRLRIESGDPLDIATLDGLIGSHDAVVSALGPRKPQDGRVMSASGRALRASLSEMKDKKIVVISSALLYPNVNWFGKLLTRLLLVNTVKETVIMEAEVKELQCPWMIVRPPTLTNGAGSGTYRVSGGKLPLGLSITRADLALFVLDALEKGEYWNSTVGVSK